MPKSFKIFISILILAAIVGVGFGIRQFFFPPGLETFKDDKSKTSFTHPSGWTVDSTEDFVKAIKNRDLPDKFNVLVKINQPESILEYLGVLNSTTTIQVGDKNFYVAHRTDSRPGDGYNPTSSLSMTHYFWKAPNGKTYLFEVSPWQKPDMNEDLKKMLETFKPLN